MRIALVVSDFSYPPREGLHAHTISVLVGLRAAGHEVKVLGFWRDPTSVDVDLAGRELGAGVTEHLRTYSGQMMKRALVERVHASAAARELLEILRKFDPEVVHLDGTLAGALSPRLEAMKRVVSFVDPPSRRQLRAARSGRGPRSILSLGRLAAAVLFEVSLRRKGVIWHVVSPSDARYLTRLHRRQTVVVIPVIAAPERHANRRGEEDEARTLRVGVLADLRQDYLLRDVTRALRLLAASPLAASIQVSVLGRAPLDQSLRTAAGRTSLEYVEWADDLDGYLATLDIALLPDTFGTGLKTRVLDVLRAGLPLIASPVAAEGLDLEDGRDLLVYRSEAELVERLAQLVRSPELRARLGTKGQATVAATYSGGVVMDLWNCVYADARRAQR